MKNRSNFRSTIFVSSEPLRSQPEPFRTSPPSSFALTSFIQMVLPVPLVCIIALALSFQLNSTLGTILLI